MSTQKFSFEEREAIWSAYDKKCMYTSEPLKIDNFHIDHIIPEEYAGKTIEFEELVTSLGLDDGFDIFGYENLVPCTPNANLRKNGLLFETNSMLFYLNIARSKKKRVIECLEKIHRRNKKGKATIYLLQCLDRGILSEEDFSSILEKHSDSPQEIFNLIEAIEFEDRADVKAVSKGDLDFFRGLPVKMGQNKHISDLDLWSDSLGKIHVRTCKEYEDAIACGYYPRTNFDIKMSVFFKHQCGLLQALKKATIPTVSYIDSPRRGILDLDLLPFTFFPYIGELSGEYKGNASYQDKINAKEILIKNVSQNTIRIEEPEGMGQFLAEVVRADFNGDGIEDILLYEGCYATCSGLGFLGQFGREN